MRPKTYRTRPLRDLAPLNFSQAKVPGFDLETYQRSTVLMVGAGGLGSQTALGLVMKGIGRVIFCDADYVELKNLTRQYFTRRDCRKNKAHRLARRFAREGNFPGSFTGIPYHFAEAIERGLIAERPSVIKCGIDNNGGRVQVARFGIEHRIPVIFSAVAGDGSGLYCFVQEPDKACFGCAFPRFLNDRTNPCNLPGIVDVLQIVAGFNVFAVDTLLCGRYREWNRVTITLPGGLAPEQAMIARNPHCPLCGDGGGDDATV